MRRVLLLLPLALAGCGPGSDFHNLSCRNAADADPEVRARIAASASPETDPAVQAARERAYYACTPNLPDRSFDY
jgi:hypothetical protein